ncbi:acyltransferase domain-containing protein [Buchnera aphidicola]|uniref:acyltransferase domain-containing protein n=1 Tax=Buchnera aphidicola TaxID=9 RepID=UPI002236F269|nr:acyltransferase domain-containing protein [Buchnera aphidicola]MCW5197776.1 acyltransferase domain-containing protein [Buchnera aphidicola (Chaitophorus viminalis)]
MIPFAMIFPGQEKQNIKILKKIYQTNKIIQNTFKKASEYLKYDLFKSITKKKINKKFKKNNFLQLGILTTSYAIYKLWKFRIGLRPKIMTGHSLGQYSALVCSKVLKFSDAIKMVAYRTKIMQKKKGSMYAIFKLKKSIIKKFCNKYSKKNRVSIACINSSNQIIITGNKKYSKKISKKCKNNGAKRIVKLNNTTISHCPSMKNLKKKMLRKFKKTIFYKPETLIIDSTKVKILENPKKIKSCLINQLCKTVKWNDTIHFMIKNKIKYFLEMGLNNTLTQFHKNEKKYISLNIKKILNLKE